jgi:hypothetical protein
MASETCATCREPLLVEIEPDSDYEDSKTNAQSDNVLDDVELTCGCHYHWECFMESYSITQCPNCSKDISSLSAAGQQQVLCTVRNEGGEQPQYDILPSSTEEAYLRAYPEERRAHAYLEFCREGDIDAIVNLVKDVDEDDAGGDEIDVLRYTGTFEGIEGSGLHVAIRYNQQEVAWLIVALASNLDWSQFPPNLLQAMEGLGLSKEDRQPGTDVRTLKDSEGRTPFTLAKGLGGVWKEWTESGRLNV